MATRYMNFLYRHFGPSEIFWLSLNNPDNYQSRNQIKFYAQEQQSLISKIETKTAIPDIDVKLLTVFDLTFPVTAIEKAKNIFVMVVTTDTWSDMHARLFPIINDLATVTSDRAASVTFIFEILEFYRQRFSLLVESQKPFSINSHTPKASFDFFKYLEIFLKKLKPLALNPSKQIIEIELKTYPFEFKLKQPIQLLDPNFLSRLFDRNIHDRSSTTTVRCGLKQVDKVVEFLKKMLGPEGHQEGEGGFVARELATCDDIVVQCVNWIVRMTESKIIVRHLSHKPQ
jgi:hypothetical protein